jgi:hypothetical protein
MRQLMRKNNGRNSGMDTPFDGGSMSDIERTFSQADMPSVIKEFVHPGKDLRGLLMRTVFRDENERNAALIYLRKCEEFGLVEFVEMMRDWLAASVSVQGRSRKEVLMATSGVVVPDMYGDLRREKYRKNKNGDGDDSDRR